MDMKVTFTGGSKVDAEYKGFVIKTDQPQQNGGENSAPSPFDYFIASIGTCAGIYALKFLQQRNISTENVSLSVTLDQNKEKKLIENLNKILSIFTG